MKIDRRAWAFGVLAAFVFVWIATTVYLRLYPEPIGSPAPPWGDRSYAVEQSSSYDQNDNRCYLRTEVWHGDHMIDYWYTYMSDCDDMPGARAQHKAKAEAYIHRCIELGVPN